MANVLDLRRRIRSVKNTRQITKAMKMVSAAKLRRAQDRAMKARPYARMLTNVLVSLVRRTDLYNEQTGEIMHPLLVEREEKNVLVMVIAGDKGFAGGVQLEHRQGGAAVHRCAARAGAERSTWSRWARRRLRSTRSSFPAAIYEKTEERYDNDLSTHYETMRHRAQPIEVAAEHPGCCCGWTIDDVAEMARSIVERYERAEIDSVYIVYNEFKCVICAAAGGGEAAADPQAGRARRLRRPRR